MEDGGRRKVLIVDYDSFVRECCSALLAAYGYQVESASDGMDALERLKLRVFDLVISDINMPALDGLGLFRAIEAGHQYLKERFLFITGAVPLEKADDSLLARMGDRLVKKPFKAAELVSSIKALTSVPVEVQLNQAAMNRRAEERFPCVRKCLIGLAGAAATGRFVAETLDISISGMRVKYTSASPLDRGAAVSAAIESVAIERDGSVMWSRPLNPARGASSGIRVSEAIPVSELLRARA